MAPVMGVSARPCPGRGPFRAMAIKASCFAPAVSLIIATAAALAPEGGSAAEGTGFRRGDVTGDGGISLADPMALLYHLFLGGASPRCLDAADADDSGRLNLG